MHFWFNKVISNYNLLLFSYNYKIDISLDHDQISKFENLHYLEEKNR